MIKQKTKPTRIEIDLTGTQGNAFFLIGQASQYARQLGKDANAIKNEMMSGDYENLILVFDREFGEYVDLIDN